MSWQEKFRQAEEAQKREQEKLVREAARQQEEKTRARQETERLVQAKDLADLERAKKELMPILDKLGVRQVLEGVSRDVWMGGVIEAAYHRENWPRLCAFYAVCVLRFEYQVARWKEDRELVRKADFSPEGGGDDVYKTLFAGYIIDKDHTELKVSAHFGEFFWGKPEIGYFIEVEDGGRTSPVIGADRFVDLRFGQVNPRDPNAKLMVEELILRTCLQRKRSKELPLQLQAAGEDDIRRNVPLYRRLFR